MFRRKNKNQAPAPIYDSDAIYRNQSIYGNTPVYSPQDTYTPPTLNSGYEPPSAGYQPPSSSPNDASADVGYRPPLFPGSAELAEVAPEPEPEPDTPKRQSGSVVLRKAFQNMTKSLHDVQNRARRSSIANDNETEDERSIKALFSERIVKGRPDLFVPSTPIPPDDDLEAEVSSPLGVLQNNISGFFSQFMKQSAATVEEEAGLWGEKQKDFNKRFGRNDAEYLRVALSNFCDETTRMYSDQKSSDYQSTPVPSPTDEEDESMLVMPTPDTPSAYTPMPDRIPQRQPIEDRIHSFMDALLAEIRKHKGWKSAGEEGLRNTRDCIEKLILDKLRDYTLGKVREEMKKEDEELEQKMKDLQFLTEDNLDVSAVCKEHPETMQKVSDQLKRIQDVSSPAEKLECIIESCRTLGALLQSGNKSGNDAGADDFLPAFIYIVLKSGLTKLPSTVEYISRFRHPDELLSEGGYCLTNLSGAVSFLQNCGGCDFDIDPDLFEREFHKSDPPPVQEEDEEDLLCF